MELQASAGSTEFRDPVMGMAFVLIEGRSFIRGSMSGHFDEEPVHPVYLDDFYMGKYPVTQKEWKDLMDRNPSYFKGDFLPVEEVSWNETREFIWRLNRLIGTDSYRLPTEAEWEYACGGSSRETYCFGSNDCDLHHYAWFTENSEGQTHPVGQKRPNAWGLYDMHGNVWEWCEDWYGSYPGGMVNNPRGPSSGINRVNRGGSWSSRSCHCRSSSRNKNSPLSRYCDVGFRLVRTP
jgi:formylglycine-generating enzyme required for sulfatase activity